MENVKRVIIADDHAVVRTGLQMILDDTCDIRIVDEATNGQELLEKLKENEFDLVVLDISMPGRDAIDVLKEIKNLYPGLPVVIFTMNPDDIFALRMIKNGASAFINKQTPPDQIIEVLRMVTSGKKYFNPAQAEMLANLFSEQNRESEKIHDVLTDREFQIMFMIASGARKDQIAQKLSLSKHTVSNHRNNILKKMNLGSNADLTRYAIQNGILK